MMDCAGIRSQTSEQVFPIDKRTANHHCLLALC